MSSILRILPDIPPGRPPTFWYSWRWWDFRPSLSLFFFWFVSYILSSQQSDSCLTNWCFYCISQELSICYDYWSFLDVLQLPVWFSWWIQGFEEVLVRMTCLDSSSFVFSHFLDCLLKILLVQMAFVIILSCFYISCVQ